MFSVCIGQPPIPVRKKTSHVFGTQHLTVECCHSVSRQWKRTTDGVCYVIRCLWKRNTNEINFEAHVHMELNENEAAVKKKAETKQSSMASLSRRPCRHWEQAHSNGWKHFLNRSAGFELPTTTYNSFPQWIISFPQLRDFIVDTTRTHRLANTSDAIAFECNGMSNVELYRCKCTVVNVVSSYADVHRTFLHQNGHEPLRAVPKISRSPCMYFFMSCGVRCPISALALAHTHTQRLIQHKPLVITRVYHHFHMCATTTEIHPSLSLCTTGYCFCVLIFFAYYLPDIDADRQPKIRNKRAAKWYSNVCNNTAWNLPDRSR